MNPTTATFTASADHNNNDASGNPLVTRYDLEFYLSGASAPFQTVSLGKPTPDGTGKITVNFTSLLGTPLAAGPVYTADVAAVGPGGRGTSAMSVDSFAYGTTCSFSVSPLTTSVAVGGGTATLTETAGSGCAWTATSNAGWLTVTGGASGSGNGTVTLTATANTSSVSRSATVTVGGQAVTVTQAGVPCSFALSPATQNIVAGGGNGTVTMTAPTGCTWTASDNQRGSR